MISHINLVYLKIWDFSRFGPRNKSWSTNKNMGLSQDLQSGTKVAVLPIPQWDSGTKVGIPPTP